MAGAITKSVPQRSVPTRAPQRIMVREVAAPATRRRRRSGGGGGGGIMGTPITGQRALIAYVLGAAQRGGQLAQIPSVAGLGAEATLAIGAAFMGKGNALLQDVSLVAGITALTRLGREGLTTAVPQAVSGDPFEVRGDDD